MKINESIIEKFFDLLYVPGNCLEVRCFSARVDFTTNRIIHCDQNTCVAGWFTSSAELNCELSRVENVSSYITVNPVSLARRPMHAKNTLKVLRHGDFCLDSDINTIRYIIVDIDPIRPAGNSKINSTQEELLECCAIKEQIIREVPDLRQSCIHGISGNGAFILVRIPDFPNNKENYKYINMFVYELSDLYSNRRCKIDTNSKSPSKLIGIPSTTKFRDKIATRDRPHRRVEIQGIGDHDDFSTFRLETMGIKQSPS